MAPSGHQVGKRGRFALCWRPLVFILAIGISILTLVTYFRLDSLVARQIRATVQLTNNESDLFRQWSAPKVPIRLRVTLFNVTNPVGVLAGEEVPKLQEVGPFTFAERMWKEDIQFEPDGSSRPTLVRYRPVKSFRFLPDESIGRPEDFQVTIPNVPLFAIVDKMSSIPLMSGWALRSIRQYIADGRDPPFVTQPANKLMFDGYQDPLIATLQWYTSWVVSKAAANDSFGLMYPRNGTWDPNLDGDWSVHTGVDPEKPLGTIESWNDREKLRCWTGEACNSINGTDGSLFPGPISRDQTLSIFNTEISRSLILDYERDVKVASLNAYRFTAPRRVFRAATADSINHCFCPNADHSSPTCQVDGVLDLSACMGVPLLISAPHFYQGDRSLRTAVDGLKPSKPEHGTFIDVEPLTGLVLRGFRRVQLNLRIRPERKIAELANLTDLILPLAWVEESAQVTQEMSDELKSQLHDRILLIRVLLLITAVVSFLIAGFVLYGTLTRSQPTSGVTYSGSTEFDYKKPHIVIKRNGVTCSHKSPQRGYGPATETTGHQLPEMQPLQKDDDPNGN